MNRLTGATTLLRFAARRERIRIPIYVLLFVFLVVETAVQSENLYATQAERNEYAATVAGNPGLIAMVGPAYAVTNVAATSPGSSAGSAPRSSG
jgi:ABC-2 type transport system permease protein